LPQFEQAIKAAIAETHVLIVSLDYKYDKALELTGIVDGESVEQMARNAGIKDITVLFDNQDFKHRNFPLKKHIRKHLQSVGKRSYVLSVAKLAL